MKHGDCLLRRLTTVCLGICVLIAFLFLAVASVAAADTPYRICLVGLDSTGHAQLPPGVVHGPSGGITKIGVWIDPASGPTQGIQSFDFTICYDVNMLSRLAIARGVDLASDWEYLTYRCDQSGQIRLIGIADMPGGSTPGSAAFDLHGVIAAIGFYVSADAALIGSCTDVSFCSYACENNNMTSRFGDTIYVPTGVGLVIGPGFDFPGCKVGSGPARVPAIDYCPGQICIDSSFMGCGDVNLNGIRGEIADIILFARFFVYGISAFDGIIVPIPFPWEQLDCDRDGRVGVTDLVMMIRMFLAGLPINGGSSLKSSASPSPVDLAWDVSDGSLRVQTSSSAQVGGLLLTYRYSGYSVGEASLLLNSGMSIQSAAASGRLRILVYPDPNIPGGAVAAGTNVLLSVPLSGKGTIELIDQEVCDYAGAPLVLLAGGAAPKEYGLLPNYPNPFNAGTVIPFRLQNDSEWRISIFNVAGQSVRTFAGHNSAGLVSVEWNGTSDAGATLASGVYFCRLTAGTMSSGRRVVMIK